MKQVSKQYLVRQPIG